MIATAAVQLRELLSAAGFGLTLVAVVAAGLTLLSVRQQARVRRVATAHMDPDRQKAAISKAEEEQEDLLLDVLGSAAADVAEDQGLETGFVRAALYLTSERKWGLHTDAGEAVPALTHPSAGPQEWGLEKASDQGKVVVTIPSTANADDRPRWAISLPVLEGNQEPGWVLYVEGWGPVRMPPELRSAAGRLLYYREVLELLLKRNASER